MAIESINTQYINLLDLPDDIIQHIFYQLDPIQMVKTRTVCVQWLHLSSDDYLWFLFHNKFFGCPNPTNTPFEKFVIQNTRQIQNMSKDYQCMWAIKNKSTALLENVLKSNVDLNLIGYSTPMYTAASHNYIDGVKLLLRYGHQIVSKPGESNPLYVAAQEGHLEVCKILIANGANTEEKFRDGYTPVYVTSQRGHQLIVQCLYENGADIDMRCDSGSTPLYIAAQEGNVDVIKYILSKSKRSLEAQFRTGFTPIYVAARNGHDSVVQILIDAGANINSTDLEGSTPVYVAAQNGYTEIVRILLEAGAHPDSHFLGGYTPLYIACQNQHLEIVKLLLRCKININQITPNGSTPIFIGSQNGSAECVRVLIENGADPRITRFDCLHVACVKQRLDVIKVLLDCDMIDINKTMTEESTALGIVIENNNLCLVIYLCERGADINKNHNKKSPLQLAVDNKYHDIVTYLTNLCAV